MNAISFFKVTWVIFCNVILLLNFNLIHTYLRYVNSSISESELHEIRHFLAFPYNKYNYSFKYYALYDSGKTKPIVDKNQFH